jgi:hypothetical protein
MSPSRHLVAFLAYLGTFLSTLALVLINSLGTLGTLALVLAIGLRTSSPLSPGQMGFMVALALAAAPISTLILYRFGYLSPTASSRYYWGGLISGCAVVFATLLQSEGLSLFWSCTVTILGIAAIGLTWWLLTRKRKPDGSTTESH